MIELMISVSILAIIIAGMTVALQQQQRQFKMTKETADMDQTGRAALDFLATEIRNAGSHQGKTFAVQFFNGESRTVGAVTARLSGCHTISRRHRNRSQPPMPEESPRIAVEYEV